MRSVIAAGLASAVLVVSLSACAASGGPRHIAVTMTDAMAFEPTAITVKQGETVIFDVRNAGEIAHEFFIGNATQQTEHEVEMQQMFAMGHDHATGVNVDAGQTEALRLSFPDRGTLEIGCHEPGHWAAGMKGTLTVQP
jgi:uncharacterized cupredoxin-like copper-binding protein